MVRVCTKAGESQSHLWYHKAAKLTLNMRRGCAYWLMHTAKRRKILKVPFCHSRHNLAQLVWGGGAWLAMSGVAAGRVARGWQAQRAAKISSVAFVAVLVLYVAFRVAGPSAGKFL